MSNNVTTREIESQKSCRIRKLYRAIMEIVKIQKEANDFLQQKNKVLETQLSLFNNSERNSSFGSTLMLACSVKSEECVKNEGDKIKICEENKGQ